MKVTKNHKCSIYLTWVTAALLLSEGRASATQASNKKSTPPDSSAAVTAGIPREQLEIEAELKKLMESASEAYGKGEYEQAISRYQTALDFTKRLDPKDQENPLWTTTSDALAKIGICHLQLHRYDKAETAFKARLEFRKENLPFDSSVASAYENLAVVRAAQGDLPGAEEHLLKGVAYLEECVKHFKRSENYSPEDIVANGDRKYMVRLLAELATVRANQGKFDEAFANCEQAFQIGEKFKAGRKSLLEVTKTALQIAEISARKERIKGWVDGEKGLQATGD